MYFVVTADCSLCMYTGSMENDNFEMETIIYGEVRVVGLRTMIVPLEIASPPTDLFGGMWRSTQLI